MDKEPRTKQMQVAIDRAKRNFDVDIQAEIKNIKADINIAENGYPAFWEIIRKDFNKDKINHELSCPMNKIYNLKLPYIRPTTTTLPMSYFFKPVDTSKIIFVAKKIEKFISDYSIELSNYNNSNNDDNDDYILLRDDFYKMIDDIRALKISSKYEAIFAWIINRAFMITPHLQSNRDIIKTNINKNRSLLMKTLYEINPKVFIGCFSNHNNITK